MLKLGDREKRQRPRKQLPLTISFSKVQHINSKFWHQKLMIELLGSVGRGGRREDVPKVKQCSSNILEKTVLKQFHITSLTSKP